jgi:hypothetical protein
MFLALLRERERERERGEFFDWVSLFKHFQSYPILFRWDYSLSAIRYGDVFLPQDFDPHVPRMV